MFGRVAYWWTYKTLQSPPTGAAIHRSRAWRSFFPAVKTVVICINIALYAIIIKHTTLSLMDCPPHGWPRPRHLHFQHVAWTWAKCVNNLLELSVFRPHYHVNLLAFPADEWETWEINWQIDAWMRCAVSHTWPRLQWQVASGGLCNSHSHKRTRNFVNYNWQLDLIKFNWIEWVELNWRRLNVDSCASSKLIDGTDGTNQLPGNHSIETI